MISSASDSLGFWWENRAIFTKKASLNIASAVSRFVCLRLIWGSGFCIDSFLFMGISLIYETNRVESNTCATSNLHQVLLVVPETGLEPAHLAAPDPKSGVSAIPPLGHYHFGFSNSHCQNCKSEYLASGPMSTNSMLTLFAITNAALRQLWLIPSLVSSKKATRKSLMLFP